MRDTSLLQLAGDEHQDRYQVEILSDPQIFDRGIQHGDPSEPRLLEWSAVLVGLAAEVGEPEGVRAIELALAPEASAPSIKNLASEGTPSRWYQDIEEFEAAALQVLLNTY
jgi:hypothetical protein